MADFSLPLKWFHAESYSSKFGLVDKLPTGEWRGRVNLDGRFGRLNETFPSAYAAMNAVERTWKREEGKKNGQCKTSTS